MSFGSSDIPTLLADFGVVVTIGSTTARGLLETTGEDLLPGAAASAIGERILVTVQTGVFSSLAVGATATVAGTQYVVSAVKAVNEGEFTQFLCAVKGT